MERIGLAASKMAQGNLLKYNVCVTAISCFFSVFIFLVCGFTVLVSLFIMSLLLRKLIPIEQSQGFFNIARVSLVALAVLIGMLNVVAIAKNIKVNKNKI